MSWHHITHSIVIVVIIILQFIYISVSYRSVVLIRILYCYETSQTRKNMLTLTPHWEIHLGLACLYSVFGNMTLL